MDIEDWAKLADDSGARADLAEQKLRDAQAALLWTVEELGKVQQEREFWDRLALLEVFYVKVARLTLGHDEHECERGDYAVVYPSKLGPVLAEVDPEWWKMGKREG